MSTDRGISVGVMYPGSHDEQGIPLIRAADISEGRISETPTLKISKNVHYEYRRTALEGGECLLTLVGTPGISAIVPHSMAGWNVARAVAVLRLKEQKNARFLRYAFSSPDVKNTIRNWCNTTVQPTLNLADIKKIPISWPPNAAREAITTILGSLDDKIDLNRRMNETLEAMARALFRDWFVDFGPTRAKIAGEAPYLAPELWELFPDRLDDEGKPEEWLDGTIGNWANLNSLSWKRQNYPETVNYLDLSSVKHGIINDISQMSAQEAPSRAQRILRTGETVIGTVRPGNGSYAYIDREGLTGSTGFACFYAEDKKFREFVYFALTDKENIDRLTHLADGGAYPAVRPDVVADTACTLSEQTVSAFHTVVSSWMNKISTNNIESHTLAQLRDLLLPKLMSGEISIRDAKKMVEDVT
ncbi:DNA polymerase beta domain-containing protein region [Acetobacter fabarum]|uniref:restriction endonuclease subunit S n=1 Tax=Acetobacter fabarum TaxID=483199 RepID=UPI0014050BB3|nr:restriction endonuclease subunit S [Acetobacter fabarum]NHO41861.1 DNA polymerase beta domain-containing protein region [Acetobacter fabarum]